MINTAGRFMTIKKGAAMKRIEIDLIKRTLFEKGYKVEEQEDIMSEYINNREIRKNTIKDIIKQLHEGKSVEDVKQQFDDVFKGVSAAEISEALT